MAKNLSLRMRQVAGLDRTGGHLPPPDRRDGGRSISAETREQMRKARLRELTERMRKGWADLAHRGDR